MCQCRGLKRWVGVVAVCAVLQMPSSAEADDMGGMFALLIGLPITITGVVGGVTVGIGNTVGAASGERPGTGWRVTGWIFGVFNGVAAALYLGTAAEWDDKSIPLIAGFTHLGLGVWDIGVTIWGSNQPERPDRRLSLGPMLIPDIEGNAALGVGLTFMDW